MQNDISKFKILKKELPELKTNVLLTNYTTFRIGGRTKYFFIARTKEDLIKAILTAKKYNLPFFILGGGSNVLVSDQEFPGLIIKMQNSTSSFILKKTGKNFHLYAEAGVLVSALVWKTGKKGLKGFEWAGGLPGTLGGAIRGNAGAFGQEIKNNIVFVEALDNNLKQRKLLRSQCQFGYRSSLFKKKNWIVLAAMFKLSKGDKKEIQKIARDHIIYREKRGHFEYPSAGSIFKNCDYKKMPKKIQKIFEEVIKKDPFPVIPAAAVIDKAGLKGFRLGDAKVSEKCPNFIVNLGKAKAKDVKKLIKLIKQKVKNKFKIVLEEEIELIP